MPLGAWVADGDDSIIVPYAPLPSPRVGATGEPGSSTGRGRQDPARPSSGRETHGAPGADGALGEPADLHECTDEGPITPSSVHSSTAPAAGMATGGAAGVHEAAGASGKGRYPRPSPTPSPGATTGTGPATAARAGRVSSRDDRAGYQGLDLGAGASLPGVRPGHAGLFPRGGRGDDPGQRGGVAGRAGRERARRRAAPPVTGRLVGTGIRVPRPRRAPALRRAARADAHRRRAALRQLGPGRHGRRRAIRRAGSRHGGG